MAGIDRLIATSLSTEIKKSMDLDVLKKVELLIAKLIKKQVAKYGKFYGTSLCDAKNEILSGGPCHIFSSFSLYNGVFQFKHGKRCFKKFIF